MKERRKKMKIDDLLNKYFDGETSCEEEEWIRNYFLNKEIPEHLLCYKPMFVYFNNEIKTEKNKKRIFPRRKSFVYSLSGIAACAIIAVSISTFFRLSDNTGKRNYVLINGKCYTDEETVRAYAKASFHEVATSKDEVFNELFNE